MSEKISDLMVQLDGSQQWSAYDSLQEKAVTELLPDYFRAKGFRAQAIHDLAAQGNVLGLTIDDLFLGNHQKDSAHDEPRQTSRARYIGTMAAGSYLDDGMSPTRERYAPVGVVDAYSGTSKADHRNILASLTNISQQHAENGRDLQRAFRRNGASRRLWLPSPNLNVERAVKGEQLAEQPIAIVGGGASGVLAAAMLSQVGFRNITIFDKRGRTNGLWQQSNVRDGTKNNPFPIEFQRVKTTAANQGKVEKSGRSIDTYLDHVADQYHRPGSVALRKATVKYIKPGDLNHRITFSEDGELKTESFPIVIYAPGIGEPLDPNDPARMATPMKRNEVGQRWQRQLETAELKRLGRSVVLVGLGNSTAEVAYQLQRKAPGIDYTILTHLSGRALQNPTTPVDGPAVYRDIRRPELTRLAGDLAHIDSVFHNARYDHHIMSGVRHWEHDGSVVTATNRNGERRMIPFDSMFTLIGYGQNPAANSDMGLSTIQERTGAIDYDFDGEVRWAGYDPDSHAVRRRVYPGYFALGPILKNTDNPNAIVIPGIQHQLQFLASSLIVRAAEATYTKRPIRRKK